MFPPSPSLSFSLKLLFPRSAVCTRANIIPFAAFFSYSRGIKNARESETGRNRGRSLYSTLYKYMYSNWICLYFPASLRTKCLVLIDLGFNLCGCDNLGCNLCVYDIFY